MENVGFDGSDLVFVGYGAVAPEYDWDDYAGVDVTGKTVVVLVNDPGFATQDPDLFKGNAMTYYGRWTYKYEEGARQGAAAVLIVHETAPAAYGWATVQNGWTGTQFNLVTEDNNMGSAAAEGWITLETAEAIFEMAGPGLPGAEGSGPGAGLPGRSHGRPHSLAGHPEHHRAILVQELPGQDPGNDPTRRIRDLHGPLGPLRHRSGPGGRPGLQRRGGQRHAESPPSWRSPKPSRLLDPAPERTVVFWAHDG